MYAEAVPPACHAIHRAQHLTRRIGEAGREDILTARLVPGMFDCGTQIETVGIFALRSTFTLIGRDWPRDMLGDGFPSGVDGLSRRLDELIELGESRLTEAMLQHVGSD